MNEEPPQSATTYTAEIDPGYAENALKKIRAAVRGNGLKPEDVTLKNFDGEILEFIATSKLTLQTKISEKRVAGKITGPRKFDNIQVVREAIQKEKHKITHNPEIISRIKKIMIERDDKGLALKNESIKFPFLNADFVYYEPCPPCKSQGKTTCKRCHGKGYEECTRCHGDGMEHCPQCQGNGQISGPKGGYQPCPRCHGHKKISCSLCQQARRIQCRVCKTKGVIICKQCNGNAWNSNISTMENSMVGNFDYDREPIPDKIEKLIERLGSKLANHVQIKPIQLAENPEGDTIVMPYMIRLPHGDIEFTIKGEDMSALLFGTQGRLINVPFFLEKLIAPATKKLEQAAKGQGNIEAHLRDATRYKTIRNIVIATSKFNKAKAAKAVLKATPLGISPEAIKNHIDMTDLALQKITKKPRQIGIVLGTGIAIAIIAGYYLTPMKNAISTTLPQNASNMTGDALTILIALIIGAITTKIWIKRARKDALKNILPKKT